MTARKRKATREPLLSTVARKLGHAAGTITKATQELTENLAALPKTVTTRVRGSASAAVPARRSRSRTARGSQIKEGAAAVNRKRKAPKGKTSRHGRAA
jgi:hypothetical protein